MNITLKPANESGVRDIDTRGGLVASMGMANALNEEKKQQVIALGRLGWSLRQIQQATRNRWPLLK